jgi:NADPH:quinone reductase-like Zn-dependent oxidoreductase
LPPDASPLPGLEVAGDIVAMGSDANRWQIGDSVMALTHGGGYAEYCAVAEDHCLAVPAALTVIEAAAVPETFFTVWYNVFMRCRLTAGETFLVHGGSSGIDTAINYRTQDWQAVVEELTGGRGVDVLLDMVAGPYMQKNMESMARDGRYSIIAFLQGPRAELNMRVVLAKRLMITGSTLRPQSTREKAKIAEGIRENVLPLLESGRVRPIIHETFALENAAAAHELMESSRHMGKIVLTVAPEARETTDHD